MLFSLLRKGPPPPKLPSPYATFQRRMMANMIDAVLILMCLMALQSWVKPYIAPPDALLQEVLAEHHIAPTLTPSMEEQDLLLQDPRLQAHLRAVMPAMLAIQIIQCLLIAAFYIGCWTWRQATPGKIIMGLCIIREDDPASNPRITLYLLRLGSMVLSVLCLFIGVFWALTNRKRRMWHDHIAGTVVVHRQLRSMLPPLEAAPGIATTMVPSSATISHP